MLYRSGYASKPGQEFVLGVDITRAGFEWALQHAALSSYKPGFHASPEAWKRDVEAKPVRVQWDPERDWRLQLIEGVRAIQIGSSGKFVFRVVKRQKPKDEVTFITETVAHLEQRPDLVIRAFHFSRSDWIVRIS